MEGKGFGRRIFANTSGSSHQTDVKKWLQNQPLGRFVQQLLFSRLSPASKERSKLELGSLNWDQ